MTKDILGVPLLVYYPALAFILLGVALLSIPRRQIRRLFAASLLWGTLLSFIFAVLMRALGLFHYAYQGPFQLLGSPIWLNFAWSPAIMVFLYFRPPMNRKLIFWSYLLTFCLMSAMLNEALSRLGLLVQTHWSSLGRFLVAAPWFFGAARFDDWSARETRRARE